MTIKQDIIICKDPVLHRWYSTTKEQWNLKEVRNKLCICLEIDKDTLLPHEQKKNIIIENF